MPGIVDQFADGNATCKTRVVKRFGRLFVVDHGQHLVGHRFVQGLDQLGIRSGIYRRHSLFPIAGTAIPEIYAVELISRNENFDLSYEIGNLGVAHIAETYAFTTAFDTDTYFAPLVLHLPNVLRCMFNRIA